MAIHHRRQIRLLPGSDWRDITTFTKTKHPQRGTDGLWAVEQTLRAGTCGAVLAWLTDADSTVMRRLQLAAEAGNSWGILFRPQRMAGQASPAALRLKLESTPRGLAVHVLKRRGGWAADPVYLKSLNA